MEVVMITFGSIALAAFLGALGWLVRKLLESYDVKLDGFSQALEAHGNRFDKALEANSNKLEAYSIRFDKALEANNTKLDKLAEDHRQLAVDLKKLEGEFSVELKKLEGKLSGDLKKLEGEVRGIHNTLQIGFGLRAASDTD